jgi:hypothetical protein
VNAVPSQPRSVGAEDLAALPPHPRLLARAFDWSELAARTRSDPETAEILAALRVRGGLLRALPPEVDYGSDPRALLKPVRDAQQRVLAFAMLARLGGDAWCLAEAKRAMAGLVAQSWQGAPFLAVAEAVLTLAAGVDWLFVEFSEAERRAVADKVWAEALGPSLVDEAAQGWIGANHNWNQVCHSGLVAGALVFAERDPAAAARIVNRAVAKLPLAAAAYAPDGVYPEGPTYWMFGTTFHVVLVEALRVALGDGFGLERFPGFLRTAEALDPITGPSGLFFNHADNLERRGYSAAALWFARENARPDLARAELLRLRAQHGSIQREDWRELPLFLLWWRPVATREVRGLPAPLAWRGGTVQPVAVLRSAWGDPEASWLAIKGGTAGHSHAHMDAGGFVFEAGGVRWAVDPERDEYACLRAAGYTQAEIFDYAQESRRWRVFRPGPEGHNILRFDGAPQNVGGRATIGPLRETSEDVSVEIDLGTTYAGQAAGVRRRATLRPDGTVDLVDEWTTLDRPVEVSWQWLTRAEVRVVEDGLRLTQAGRRLALRVGGAGWSVVVEPAGALLRPPVDSPLPGHTRIVLRVPTGARSAGRLSVRLALEA